MRAVKITLLALAGLLAGAVVFLVVADRLNQPAPPDWATLIQRARQYDVRIKRHLLQRDEVVLGLGEAQPESYICVPGADHVRHAKGIALDSNVILAGPLN